MRRHGSRTVPLELVEAITRVGLTPDARAAWLLAFAHRDLSDAHAAEDARQEARVFMAMGSPVVRTPRPAGPPEHWTLADLHSRAGRPDQRGRLWLNDAGAIHALQVKVREALATFTTKGRLDLPDDVRVAVRRDGERVAPVLTGAPDDGSGFLAAVATLLLDVGLRLRRCQRATCATVFLAVGRQDYCSARCSQTERTARWRTKRDGHAKASDAGAPPVRRVRRRRHPVQRDARS